jgi:outer membrane murein-binding lipoprotein Lpp
MRVHMSIALLLLAGCSSRASKQDQLNSGVNESTPEAANVLESAAQSGMNDEAALNGGASESAAKATTTASVKKETRLNPPKSASPQQPAEPSLDEPGNSNSD